ncbi:GMC family oxidoreductase N-terminal domain-containing protein [Leptolyngbya sp. FACHB-671]|uniref:GMC oxidoreductase n=1 Tax=Leptolyngbya sp. FACHB-671 TaxID=2692812 RepID=UPI001689920C|nr:GMC oxidoreductase [Leptolyngbya sp. FACHB-671]MBD2068242.1 GMC family oxidoreductase N-terminal domain-containing protein [Leptolyngbya sp. FACHB-671]
MVFDSSTYINFVSEETAARERLFLQYMGRRDDFDIIIVGSGIGGGVLADNLTERLGSQKRILVLEAGSFLYPTHVYNFCRFPNFRLAQHYGCDTFWQAGNNTTQNYIGEKPQLNFGGRSIFWSGLIPTVQDWELDYFPPAVRQALTGGLLKQAGETMNESRSMGAIAKAMVEQLRQSPLANDFHIQETPRALHQPYLEANGTPRDQFFTEPTGVFNTAELLVNQLGLTPGVSQGDGPGLHLLVNHFVEDVQRQGSQFELVARNTQTGEGRAFKAGTVILAAGSVESPKLLRRSSLYPSLPQTVQDLVGRGLTDHPTTTEITTFATSIGNVALKADDHAKIVFYSRGLRDANNQIRYPFNIEMNINHEYWHLRENDPEEAGPRPGGDTARIDIKFSFGNCLDENNEVKPAPPFGYVPEIVFRNQSWADYLAGSRFPAFAGWQKSPQDIWNVLNEVTGQIFGQFMLNGQTAQPDGQYGQGGKGFGWGTVHHAAGSLRMPYRPALDAPFATNSVVDEDLRVIGTQQLYVCDMSVMPLSTTANPVRTLVALALRLSQQLS